MELLFESEHLQVHYDRDRDILMAKWLHCDNAEKLTTGLGDYKDVFEKIIPEKIIWDETGLNYAIPPNLQDWIHDFLDAPACQHKVNFKVAHVLSPDLYATLSLMDMYTDGKAPFPVGFFAHERAALDWIEAQTAHPGPAVAVAAMPEWKIEKFLRKEKARITIDIDLNELPDYLFEFRKMLRNRKFFAECRQRFLSLTPKEKFILALLIKGKTNKEIAEINCISCETVKTHRRNLLRKLACPNMAELMQYHVFL